MIRVKSFMKVAFVIAFALVSGCMRKPEPVPIPGDAIMHARMDNLADNWDKLKESQFFQQAEHWKLWDEPWMTEILQPYEDFRLDFKRNTGLPFNETTFMMLFGKKVDMALLPGQPLPSVVFIADLGKKSTPIKKLNKGITSLDKERLSTYDYKKHTVTVVKTKHPNALNNGEPTEIFYSFHRNRVISSSSRQGIEKVINVIVDGLPVLTESPTYLELCNTIEKADLSFFGLPPEILKQVQSSSSSFGMEIESVPVQLKAFLSGASMVEKGINFQTAFIPVENQKDVIDRVYMDRKAVKNASKWLPAESIAGVAGGINLPGLIQHQKSILTAIPTEDGSNLWHTITWMLQESTGMDIPGELERWGGDGAFMVLENIRMATMIPIPELAIGFHADNKKLARAFSREVSQTINDRFADSLGQMVEMELPGGNVYSYVPVPLVPGLQPGCCVIDDYFIIGTAATTVTSAYLAMEGEQSRLFDSPDFTRLVEKNGDRLIMCKGAKPPKFAAAGKTALDSLTLILMGAGQKPEIYREILNSLETIPSAGFNLTLSDQHIVYNGFLELL